MTALAALWTARTWVLLAALLAVSGAFAFHLRGDDLHTAQAARQAAEAARAGVEASEAHLARARAQTDGLRRVLLDTMMEAPHEAARPTSDWLRATLERLRDAAEGPAVPRAPDAGRSPAR